MSIQVKIKLRLTKITKVIKVEYNTFQKIAYDEYLITSLVKRGKNKQQCMAYIDDITGDGSLNAHFKKLYDKIKDFKVEQLDRIMSKFEFPILKKDNSNSYTYYPQIDVSIHRNKVYKGDLINYENLAERVLNIIGEVTSLTVDEKEPVDKPDMYEISIDESGKVKLVLRDKSSEYFFNLDSHLFKEIVVKDIENIDKYQGKIHKEIQGSDWHYLSKSAFESLFSNNKYFYLNDEDYCAISGDGVRKIEVAQISGLHIYRDSYVPFGKDRQISEKVLEFLISQKSLGILKSKAFVELLRAVEPSSAVKAVNSTYNNNSITREVAQYAIELLRKGHLTGWNLTTLNTIVEHCDATDYDIIYRINNGVNFSIQQLIKIDYELLIEKDKKKVDKYYADRKEMQKTIESIVGSVSTRGLREAAKKLKQSDSVIKRFSKLCNNLLGHERRNIENASDEELELWHKEALELEELAQTVESRLSNK